MRGEVEIGVDEVEVGVVVRLGSGPIRGLFLDRLQLTFLLFALQIKVDEAFQGLGFDQGVVAECPESRSLLVGGFPFLSQTFVQLDLAHALVGGIVAEGWCDP